MTSSVDATNQHTVGAYLVGRLEQLNIKHVMGIPGDYVLALMDLIDQSSMELVGTCNELNTGYAADAYARIKGLSCICLTYGVGGLSSVNAVAGAYAERSPVIVLSGAPALNLLKENPIRHHTVAKTETVVNVFKEITVAAHRLDNPQTAPDLIDAALTACLRESRPIYLELPADQVKAPCRELPPWNLDVALPCDPDTIAEAVADAVALIDRAENPIILAGVEVKRRHCRAEMIKLATDSGLPIASTYLGKGVVPEALPTHRGVFSGVVGSEAALKLVKESDLVLILGGLMSNTNLSGTYDLVDPDKTILAYDNQVRVGRRNYASVPLAEFVKGLTKALGARPAPANDSHPSAVVNQDYVAQPEAKMTAARFWERINLYMKPEHILIPDTGSALRTSADVYLPDGAMYIGQAFYLSIGFTIGAGLGASLAAPNKRPLILVGDGAAQMTIQEISTMIRRKSNAVIIVLNNDGYQIERVLHETTSGYNEIQNWQFHMLPQVFGGGWGADVFTEGEFEQALARTEAEPDQLAVLNVHTTAMDLSPTMTRALTVWRAYTKSMYDKKS